MEGKQRIRAHGIGFEIELDQAPRRDIFDNHPTRQTAPAKARPDKLVLRVDMSVMRQVR